ncbi:MAG TPA: site-specific integrase [Microthrixaceae bacterium]|nr:site-specific integrase [Microthrixaceae bacterium]
MASPPGRAPSRRRGHGEGSVYKNDRGQWVATAEVRLGLGPSRRRITRKAKTKAEAIRKVRHAERELEAAGVVIDAGQSVDAYLRWWLEHVAPVRVKSSTVAQYRWIAEKHLIPRIGNHRLGRLTTGHVQTLVTSVIADGYAPNTTRQIVGVLSGALRHAVRTDLILRNPCQLVDLPRVVRSIEDDTLTPEEVVRLLVRCKDTRWEAFATLALGYGFRQGELLALTWGDVQLDNTPTVRIRSTIKWPPGGGWYVEEPKTRGSIRVVEIDAGTAELLRTHRRRQQVEAATAGDDWTDHGFFVFTTETGSPIQDRNCLRWWYGRLKAADLEKRPFHAARRTAITNMAAAGVPLEVAASIVGHASIRMTAEVYNRVRPRGRIEAAQLIGRMLAD